MRIVLCHKIRKKILLYNPIALIFISLNNISIISVYNLQEKDKNKKEFERVFFYDGL